MSLTWLDYAEELRLPSLTACGVTIYPDSHELFISEKSVPCSLTHFSMLRTLLLNFCQTVPHEQLMHAAGRQLRYDELNRLRVQMCSLKKLLKVHGAQLEIRAVRDYGYQARPRRGG